MKTKPYLYKGRFYNYQGESIKKYIKSIIVSAKDMLRKRGPFFPNGKKQTLQEWTTTPIFKQQTNTATITWLGHASFLCQLSGYNIVTDPVFGEISRIFKRKIPSPLIHTSLPSIHVVVISHNHQDHLDKKSLVSLQRDHNPLFFVPQGDKKWFDRHGFSRVIEYAWWEQHTLPGQEGFSPLTLQFLPSHHWSGRGLFSINRSLWGSWLIKNDSQSIYFAGDTAFSNHFKTIGDAHGPIDIALLPIGPCHPENGMRVSHITPAEALQAFNDLNAKHFIPMHWGTFRHGAEYFDYAINKITSLWNDSITHSNKKLHLIKCGEVKEINQES